MNDDGFISGDAITNTNTGAKGIPRESIDTPSGKTPMDHKGLIIARSIAIGFSQNLLMLLEKNGITVFSIRTVSIKAATQIANAIGSAIIKLNLAKLSPRPTNSLHNMVSMLLLERYRHILQHFVTLTLAALRNSRQTPSKTLFTKFVV